MREVELTVKNTAGLHARPAHFLVMAALRHPNTELRLRRLTTGHQASFDWTPVGSIIGLMALSVRFGERVVVRAQGGDEHAALVDVEDVLSNDMFAIDFGSDLHRAMDDRPQSAEELFELLNRSGTENIRQWIASPRARNDRAYLKSRLVAVLRDSHVTIPDTPSRDELAERIIARYGA